MYKFIGLAMLSVFALMVIPGNLDALQEEGKFYGLLTMVHMDANGNEVFAQSIHNQLVNTGEDFILDAVFEDGTVFAADVQIGSICVSIAVTFIVDEGETATDFDGDNTANNTNANCIEDETVTTTGSVATIGPLTFSETAGSTHIAQDATITGIAICQNVSGAAGGDFEDCATSGILFAVVDVTDTTLGTGETVDITYTFNLESPSS